MSKKLLDENHEVIGIDSVNSYYSVDLKEDRLNILKGYDQFHFYKQDLADKENLLKIFKKHKPVRVINFAAQAGVKHSITHPEEYITSNVLGFLNLLEGCRHYNVEHLLYASSSSVYGASTAMPYQVNQNTDHPFSLYAATKKSNELMAHSYASLYQIPVTGLRLFSVYGPWGRPDMVLFIFTKNILEKKPIDVYNYGKIKRDFTYIKDVVNNVYKLLDHIPSPNDNWNADAPNPSSSFAPYTLFNIGNNNPIKLTDFIEIIEEKLGLKAQKNMLKRHVADSPTNYADASTLHKAVGYHPQTKLKEGVHKCIDWYREYHNV